MSKSLLRDHIREIFQIKILYLTVFMCPYLMILTFKTHFKRSSQFARENFKN